MTSRRAFLGGLLASGLLPTTGWASVGAPHYISAAKTPNGTYELVGLSKGGDIVFSLPIEDRGHAAAAHPTAPIVVAFARRPGDFADVVDCRDGRVLAHLRAPEGRHFYGHGVFSADASRMYVPENDYENGQGMISVWDTASYTRMGEFSSGGVGPHEIALMPDGAHLVVANGGIETHPETGRMMLNLPEMAPNLSYLTLDGTVVEQVALDPQWHKNSIRHLDVRADGRVAFAMQWEGDKGEMPPLLGLHSRGAPLILAQADAAAHRALNGYAGSVVFSDDGRQVAMTSPRGNQMQVFDGDSGAFLRAVPAVDVCGLSADEAGFVYSTGAGLVQHEGGWAREHALKWDNHMVRVRG